MTDMEGVLCDVETKFLYEYMIMSVVPRLLSRKFYTGPWIHTISIIASRLRQETKFHTNTINIQHYERYNNTPEVSEISIGLYFYRCSKRFWKVIWVLVIGSVIIFVHFSYNKIYVIVNYDISFVGSLDTQKTKNLE